MPHAKRQRVAYGGGAAVALVRGELATVLLLLLLLLLLGEALGYCTYLGPPCLDPPCRGCSPGWYCTQHGDCHQCEAGRYSPSPPISSGSFTCIDCAEGQYSYSGSITCIDCRAGRYSSSSGASSSSTCIDCEVGQYSYSGSASCAASCAPGKYASALNGGASAGSLTSTLYEDSQCAIRATECGLDDVNMPADGSDCAVADVTNKPAETALWVSGECMSCPAGEECAFPFFDMQHAVGQAMVAQGVNPAYAKITCTGGVATVEHFSDAECTEANKVSNDALTTGYTAVMLDMLSADDATAAIVPCLNLHVDFQSGVSISGAHCDTIMTMRFDEVRPRFPRRTRARGGS